MVCGRYTVVLRDALMVLSGEKLSAANWLLPAQLPQPPILSSGEPGLKLPLLTAMCQRIADPAGTPNSAQLTAHSMLKPSTAPHAPLRRLTRLFTPPGMVNPSA